MVCWGLLRRAGFVALVLAASATASCGGGPTEDGDGSGGMGGDDSGTGGSADESGGSGSDSDESGGGPGSGGSETDGSTGGGENTGGETATGGSEADGGEPSTGGSDGTGGDPGTGGLGGASSGGSSTGGEANTGGTGGIIEPFITVWNTAAVSPNPHHVATLTNDKTILLPLAAGGDYDFSVDWGDGSLGEVTGPTDPDREHVYAEAGTYVVTLLGTIEGWHFPADETDCGIDPECIPDVTSDAWKLLEITQWGAFRFGSTRGAFERCSNLEITATDQPDLSAPTNLRDAFADCTSLSDIPGIAEWDLSAVTSLSRTFYFSGFDGDVSTWNTSNINNMMRTFAGTTAFDGDLSGWDTSNVTSMARMFAAAEVFNQDISGWDTSKVLSMTAMFATTVAFNQDISAWDTSAVTDMSYLFDGAQVFNQDLSTWDTSNVKDMAGMFANTLAFNQDLSAWNTASVLNMNYMFARAYAFDQDLGGWEVGALTSATSMLLTSAVSSENYDALLIGWAAQSTTSGVDLGAGAIQYSSAAVAARDVLTGTRSWTITDGGLAP